MQANVVALRAARRYFASACAAQLRKACDDTEAGDMLAKLLEHYARNGQPVATSRTGVSNEFVSALEGLVDRLPRLAFPVPVCFSLQKHVVYHPSDPGYPPKIDLSKVGTDLSAVTVWLCPVLHYEFVVKQVGMITVFATMPRATLLFAR